MALGTGPGSARRAIRRRLNQNAAVAVSLTSPIETSFIELISEHSGKSRAVVGEAGRRGI